MIEQAEVMIGEGTTFRRFFRTDHSGISQIELQPYERIQQKMMRAAEVGEFSLKFLDGRVAMFKARTFQEMKSWVKPIKVRFRH